ncbi:MULTISPECIES: DUF6968 family protein [unclassified Corynebacterium]|uniref:DUF6968 family protein n=1 Tax=unclassified Corynebacterium TaxID=2624378 RepID=UPI0029C9D354|nr:MULTISPECIES: hypothetical protein [unclassified Corynebacterium]WPF65663.1 hypothetical protein OLX12_08815 [Corynebacterium sp. 22KM0430]WPF68159.1 hypothetical protein OLW90_08810 [Corynebacterium sp. 21KM1197]
MIVRELTRSDGRPVVLRMEAPTQEGGDWFTRWSIEGLSEKEPLITVSSGGIDPLQSLLCALAGLGDRVHSSGIDLRFLGSEQLQLLRARDLPEG